MSHLTTEGTALARRLLAYGIPVVVLTPQSGWKIGDPSDLHTPKGWNRVSAAKASEDIDTFRPGIDTLAMVAGHGLDVIDIDSKDGGDISMLPEGLDILGIHRTPSGGWHVFIRSTGISKISPLFDRSTGAKIGDYCGGTTSGKGRMLAYLPGSWRPKYDGKDYTVEQPIDFDRIAGPVDPVALSWLFENGGTTGGEQAAEADASGAAAWLRTLPPVPVNQCGYGAKIVTEELAAADAIGSGGRHGWAVRTATRFVELARNGCIGSDAFEAWAAKLNDIKPEGGSSVDGILGWAFANAKGSVNCSTHTPGVAPAVDDVEAVTVADLHATFRRWLGPEFDVDVVTATAASAVVQMKLTGDPAWLLVVAGSGSAKTETVGTLESVGAYIEGDISSAGALLSGSSNKDRDDESTGGLLPRIGDEGILVLKDVTTLLSKHSDARAQVFAGLREVYDGSWTRSLGSDGGKTVTWSGRLTIVGGVTTSWDEHHAAVAAMGDRFLLIRLRTANRINDGMQALMNLGSETDMRADLRRAMAGAVMHADTSRCNLTLEQMSELVMMADLTTRARSQTVNNFKGDVQWSHEPEAATRLTKQIAQIVKGAKALGLSDADAMLLGYRIAWDTIPFGRAKFISAMLDADGPEPIKPMRERLNVSYSGAQAAMDTLIALGFVERIRLSDPLDSRATQYLADFHASVNNVYAIRLSDDEINTLRTMRAAATELIKKAVTV